MDNIKIINEIKSLMNTPGTCSNVTSEFLYKQKCLYLLSRITNTSGQNSYYSATNEIIQKYRYSCCKNIFHRLNNIPYAVIKGAVLSNSIYGKPFYRLSGDIDILVSPNNAKQVTDILNDEGFIQGRIINEELMNRSREELIYHKLYTHQLASFHKKTDFLFSPFITVDVNFDIAWGESTEKIDIDHFLKHTEMTSIYDINVKKPSPVYEFISMCMHHYKDMNSIYLLYRKGYCFYEFLDIYYYLINQKISVVELYKVAQQYNVAAYLYYCIYYVNELFHNDKLNEYLNVLESPEGIELLNCFGLNKDERHIWKIPFLDRVFDINFKQQFKNQLDDIDLSKIEINMKYMVGKTKI